MKKPRNRIEEVFYEYFDSIGDHVSAAILTFLDFQQSPKRPRSESLTLKPESFFDDNVLDFKQDLGYCQIQVKEAELPILVNVNDGEACFELFQHSTQVFDPGTIRKLSFYNGGTKSVVVNILCSVPRPNEASDEAGGSAGH
jgi:hypothetical protein